MALFGLIAFTEIRQAEKRIRTIIIRLNQVDGYQFLTRRDVLGYLTNGGADPITGKEYKEVDFRRLEKRLRQHGLVKSCQVSRDLMGDLVVVIEQPRPLARLVAIGNDDNIHSVSGQYVSEEGRFFSGVDELFSAGPDFNGELF